MKKAIYHAAAILLGSMVSPAVGQAQGQVSGEFTPGVQSIELSTNSSKFNEYRDLRDGFYMQSLRVNVIEPESGWFLDFDGKTLLRDDQRILMRLGHLRGRWSLKIDHNETPHRLSNKAMSPYLYRGDGLFTVSAKVPIIKDGNDPTGTPSLVPTASQMAINDTLIARYLETYLRPVNQGVQRERTAATLNVLHAGPFDFRLTYLNEHRDGSRNTYGPIGDRPPRTMNVQLPEPVQYITREVHANAELGGRGFHARLNYAFSAFDNRVDVMQWENLYFTADPGADFITTVPGTERNVSDFGQRSLAPDNFSHSVSLSAGFELPLESRLTSTVALGYMLQDERLLPYSSSTLGGDLHPERGDGLDWNDPNKLPRATANAKMRTTRFDLEYTINPVSRLNLRPFVRYYKLDNMTPTAQWRYVTQDVAGTTGDVDYRNFRRNLAYAYDKLKFGLDVRQYFSFWRTTLGLGYAYENINRKFREADTGENILGVSVRTRPANKLFLSAGYLYGVRTGDGYNYNVTSQSYWYTFDRGENEVDNPQFLFANHPDLRKYDVSDRRRNQANLTATFIASHNLDISAAYRYRKDNFDSPVVPVAPLEGTAVQLPNPADADALTPGQQLGLLSDKRHGISINVQHLIAERWTVSAFADREEVASSLRGMVFNENQRREPSNPNIQSPTQLGPWTDPNRLYNAGTEEVTNTLGLGIGYDVIEGKLRVLTDLSLSRATVDLDYTGYGSDPEFLERDWETFQFGFNDPGTVRYDQTIISASLEYTMLQNLILGLHYSFYGYRIEDWVQEPAGPWVEQVDSEFLLRDTSRDNRWGNRLVNLGSYLAPSYDAPVWFVTLTYRF